MSGAKITPKTTQNDRNLLYIGAEGYTNWNHKQVTEVKMMMMRPRQQNNRWNDRQRSRRHCSVYIPASRPYSQVWWKVAPPAALAVDAARSWDNGPDQRMLEEDAAVMPSSCWDWDIKRASVSLSACLWWCMVLPHRHQTNHMSIEYVWC